MREAERGPSRKDGGKMFAAPRGARSGPRKRSSTPTPVGPISCGPLAEQKNRLFHFEDVNGTRPDLMGHVERIFNKVLQPLYGPQEKAIGQIRESNDRVCHLLFEGEEPVAVLQYKTDPSNEFAESGVKKSVEVKSFFVCNPVKNKGKGIAKALLDKLLETKLSGNEHFGYHLTVSEEVPDSLSFFRYQGFKVKNTMPGRYKDGIKEYLLFLPAKEQELTQSDLELEPKFEAFLNGGRDHLSSEFRPVRIKVVKEAHFDDIHCLLSLGDGTFLSGSKDNAISRWAIKGGRIQPPPLEVEPFMVSERNWITAMTHVNSAYWLSGNRNGTVSLWRSDTGKKVRDISLTHPSSGRVVSHPFNKQRVNCLTPETFDQDDPVFFAGFATRFTEFSLIEGEISSTKTHQNDWVYCIEALDERNLLVVTGTVMDIWEKVGTVGPISSRRHDWQKRCEVHQNQIPGVTYSRGERPFITAVSPVNRAQLMVGDFKACDGLALYIVTTK